MLLKYFCDPLLQASMIGSIFMCLASSLIGVMAFVRKESLIGETLSHAAFPGAVLGVILGMSFFDQMDLVRLLITIISAFLFSILGIVVVRYLQQRFKVKEDAALCFVLSTFVGIGVVLTSLLQTTHPIWFREVQTFFYGQAATMLTVHVVLYASLTTLVIFFLIWKFPLLKMVNFDPKYAQSLGVNSWGVQMLLILFIAFAVVIGIKAVGIVLMSGMLIAPAIAARRLTSRLSHMLVLAGLFGMISAIAGNILSYEIPVLMAQKGEKHLNLPTGPLILLIAATFSILSLLFAPNNGVVYRYLRALLFHQRCMEENFIKAFWKKGLKGEYPIEAFKDIGSLNRIKRFFFLYFLQRKGDIKRGKQLGWQLTERGEKKATQIVRIHRLFELYLALHLNVRDENVHAIAEEMEHYITPEIEQELTKLLDNPQEDPHSQPIPGGF
ncbi:MAG: metal ABC transporter permease [Simkaniaceae bacterium]|nr:metal ABC transporter permease [Simkaniaceae bacterium]